MSRGWILVVEDDEDILSTLKEILSMEGYEVQTAQNGRLGLDTLRTVEGVSLVLLDLMLPVLSGPEFLSELRRDPNRGIASVPVVITSASFDVSEEIRQMANIVLKKPVDLDRLLGVVRHFMFSSSLTG